METEFKFRLDDMTVFDRIVESAEVKSMGIDAVETIEMNATYFDTADYDFRSKGIAFRTRTVFAMLQAGTASPAWAFRPAPGPAGDGRCFR